MSSQKRQPAYISWASMKARCLNPKVLSFKNYGGRGITICDSWLQFENFLADMGQRPAGMTLDRINNDGNYEPSNCRWATLSEQALNRKRTKKPATQEQIDKVVAAFENVFGHRPQSLTPSIRKLTPCPIAAAFTQSNEKTEEREHWLSDLKSDKFTDRHLRYASLSKKVL